MKIDLKNTFKGWLVWAILFAAIIFAFTAIYPQMITPEMKTSLDQMLGSFTDRTLKLGFPDRLFRVLLSILIYRCVYLWDAFRLEQSDH